MNQRLLLIATSCYLLVSELLSSGSCCSPKAVRSVIVGRGKAQAEHEAKRAKYLTGETKTVGEKLGLSKGGVIMEQIGVDRLRSEIRYLESVEKLLQKNAKKEVWLAKEIAKAEVKGKPLKGAAAKMNAQKQAKLDALANAPVVPAVVPSGGGKGGGVLISSAAAAAPAAAPSPAMAQGMKGSGAARMRPGNAPAALTSTAAVTETAEVVGSSTAQAATAAADAAKKSGKFRSMFSRNKAAPDSPSAAPGAMGAMGAAPPRAPVAPPVSAAPVSPQTLKSPDVALSPEVVTKKKFWQKSAKPASVNSAPAAPAPQPPPPVLAPPIVVPPSASATEAAKKKKFFGK